MSTDEGKTLGQIAYTIHHRGDGGTMDYWDIPATWRDAWEQTAQAIKAAVLVEKQTGDDAELQRLRLSDAYIPCADCGALFLADELVARTGRLQCRPCLARYDHEQRVSRTRQAMDEPIATALVGVPGMTMREMTAITVAIEHAVLAALAAWEG